MKVYTLTVISVLALASCTGNSKKISDDSLKANEGSMDTSLAARLNTPAQKMEYCFINTAGKMAQDTTAIHLVINGNKVIGDMNWLPKEKDRRKGTLLGIIKGDNIKAIWTFMQEGMTDTLAAEFKLAAQQLAQKPMKLNTATGREQLDKESDYTIIYKLDNCEKFKSNNK